MAGAGSERGNPEIARSFAALGGLATKKEDLYNALKALGIVTNKPIERGGRPDYTVLLPPFGFLIEAKAAPDYLQFSQFETKQRAWLWATVPISYVWIWLGTEPPHRDGGREAYLLDWPSWCQLESQYLSINRMALPFDGPRAARQTIGRYALEWAGNRTWRIPAGHPAWRRWQGQAALAYTHFKRAYQTGVYDGPTVNDRLLASGGEAPGVDERSAGPAQPADRRGRAGPAPAPAAVR